MKVLLTIAGLDPEFGGPSRSVPALAEALARNAVSVELFACESAAGQGTPRLPDASLVSTRLLPFADRASHWTARSNGFFSALRERAVTDTVIHDNGLWLPSNHAVVTAARVFQRPLLISPRGMLTPWARQYRGLKKQLAWWLYQRRDLRQAQVLHATSPAEAEGFRKAGFSQPIAVVPNGVELPLLNRKSEIGNRKSEIRTVLFLSRIHPVKGLANLIEAWAQIKPVGWRVVVAGDDENGHRQELEEMIRQRQLAGQFEFIGPVQGEAKLELYQRADLFVLPSHTENFGIAIAEALAAGLPVITTRGTPWEELETRRCGWWVEIGAEPLANALQQAFQMSDAEREEMGRRGRKLIEEKYTWPAAAQKMAAVYGWMLGHEPKPECVSMAAGID